MCGKDYAFKTSDGKQNTTNLIKHLKTHPDEFK